jgi:hypothetical protein
MLASWVEGAQRGFSERDGGIWRNKSTLQGLARVR